MKTYLLKKVAIIAVSVNPLVFCVELPDVVALFLKQVKPVFVVNLFHNCCFHV